MKNKELTDDEKNTISIINDMDHEVDTTLPYVEVFMTRAWIRGIND